MSSNKYKDAFSVVLVINNYHYKNDTQLFVFHMSQNYLLYRKI